MGGTVVPGTIAETGDGVRFDITEGGATVRVVHHGDPPDLFEDGAPVVVEGRWRGDEFDSERLLIRHGNEYTPPTESRRT
jgi:cytochrome c-type biogenesis protein CcmE